LRTSHELRERLDAEARVLARGTYVLSFLRREGLLSENRHLVLGLADTLLRSLRSLRLEC
jgi:hypothetical protein